MAPHPSILAWKIPWTEEPGRLQAMGLLKIRHDWATSLSVSYIGERSGNPLQCSCLENPRDRGAYWAAVGGVAQSRTRLKRLSSSSCSRLLLKSSKLSRLCLRLEGKFVTRRLLVSSILEVHWLFFKILGWEIPTWLICKQFKVLYPSLYPTPNQFSLINL